MEGPRGPPLVRLELRPALAWLLRSRVRAVAAHEEGLSIERGSGTELIRWSEVESLIDASVTTVGVDGRQTDFPDDFELQLAGGRRLRLEAGAGSSQPLVEIIVARAGLEWVTVRMGGRSLPPMALKPAAAANLRQSLQAR